MTGYTHRQYSISFAFIAAMVMYHTKISNINYYLSLPIILQIAKYGGVFPDIDHHWMNVKDKTVPNKIINTIIRLTGGKHRSWQTHSIDIVVVFMLIAYFLPQRIYEVGRITEINKEVLSIIMISFGSGWLSHIVADMMTSGGVRLTCFSKFKVRLVPRNIGKLRFNTGNEWEEFVYRCTRVVNMGLGTACLVYPLIKSDYIVNIINVIK